MKADYYISPSQANSKSNITIYYTDGLIRVLGVRNNYLLSYIPLLYITFEYHPYALIHVHQHEVDRRPVTLRP